MPGHYTVVFTRNTAVVLPGHKPRFFASRMAKFLVNPDLTHLQGVPRHFWKLQRGAVVEMTPSEKHIRLKQLERETHDSDAHRYLYPYMPKLALTSALLLAAGFLTFVGGFIHV